MEGNAIIWQTLKSAAENILDGDVDLANAILEASSVSTPHGSLYRCYDELGALYSVSGSLQGCPQRPLYTNTVCFSVDPQVLLLQPQGDDGGQDFPVLPVGRQGAGGGGGEERRRHRHEHSGFEYEAVFFLHTLLLLRSQVKVAPGEIDGRIESTSGTSVRVFKEQVAAYFQQESQRESKEEEDPFAREQRGRMARITKERLRVVYLGQELEDKRTLGHYNVSEEMVVHIYLRPE